VADFGTTQNSLVWGYTTLGLPHTSPRKGPLPGAPAFPFRWAGAFHGEFPDVVLAPASRWVDPTGFGFLRPDRPETFSGDCDAGHRQSHRLATRCGVTGSAEATNMTADVLAIIFLSITAIFLAAFILVSVGCGSLA